MSESAVVNRSRRQSWALPGSAHDRTVRIARMVLPTGVGVLAAFLAVAPLTMRGDVSFVLDKNKVAVAKERMRVTEALYRGEDSKGEPFSIHAGSAVQATSKDPVVRLNDLTARILLKEGPATLDAKAGHYNMDSEVVTVDGPLVFASSDGYRLATRDVAVSLKSRQLASGGPVDGQMPLGTFSANRISADLAARSVTLEGGARLHIVQRGGRGQ
jgi:lipopolysaccharide export system protein LptC